jgi:predicted ATPase
MTRPSPESLVVKGFKSIREMDLKLRPLNVLIGANGAGKSNFIGLFRLLNQIIGGNLQTYVGSAGGADTLLHFGRKTTSELVVDCTFHRNGYKATLVPTAEDSLIFQEELCWGQGYRYSRPYDVVLGRGNRETGLRKEVETKKPIATHVHDAMASWKVYHFHDTSDSAKMKQTGDIEDNAVLRPDASNLAAFLYTLREKHPSSYAKIVETVQLVAPFFGDFALRPSALNEHKIRLEWKEQGSDSYFNAAALSDGTLRFICLATLLLQPTLHSTVIVDEPELGLHPYAITVLASMLQAAAEVTTVIVSTQSVPLVNQFTPEDIIVVEREEHQSVFKRPTPDEMKGWLDDYGLGDLWEKNIIGGRPQR